MTEPGTTIEEPVPEPVPRKRRRARRVLVTILALVVLVVGGGALYSAYAMGGTKDGRGVRLVVRSGATGAEIARQLEDLGIVRSAFVFRLVARFRGVATDLKPGVYETRTGLGVSGALDILRKGIPLETLRFTVPEGKTIREIADIVGRNTHVTRAALLRAVSRAPRPRFVPRGKPLEGFLFPKTYEITKKATAEGVVKLMLDQFEREVADLDVARLAERRDLSPYEAIILASLIEKEARRADEQPLVSSVIHNRLERPMRLQIDATIQYVYIERDGKPKNPLETSDYSLRSEFNTYQIDGLPPTPIAAPGLGAIRAALRPERTDFLFYRLCDPDKLARGHVFGRTLQERDREWQRTCA